MKAKTRIGLTLIGLLVVGWAGRLAWRAHHDLVTLQVRNMPLQQVISKLEAQSGERILVGGPLSAQVTLEVKNAPMAEVLERVGKQAGAWVATVHAVHQGSGALDGLVAEIEQGNLNSPAGWTNLAPRWPDTLPGPGELSVTPVPVLTGSAPPGPFVTVDEEVRMTGEPEHGGVQPIQVIRFRGAGSDGQPVEEELMVSERVVLQEALLARLGEVTSAMATRANARELARRTDAHCTTLLVLEKSSAVMLGLGGGPLLPARTMKQVPAIGLPGGADTPSSDPDLLASAAANARRAEASRFVDLTPEQRVAQARERAKTGLDRFEHP